MRAYVSLPALPLDRLARRFGLSPASRPRCFGAASGLRLALVASDAVMCLDPRQPEEPAWVLEPAREPFTAAAAIFAPAGDRLAVASGGHLTLLDGDQVVVAEGALGAGGVRLLTATQVAGACRVVTATADGRIRVFNGQAREIASIQAPGPVAALDAIDVGGALWVAAAVHRRSELVIWDMARVLAEADARPSAVLLKARPPFVLAGPGAGRDAALVVSADAAGLVAFHACPPAIEGRAIRPRATMAPPAAPTAMAAADGSEETAVVVGLESGGVYRVPDDGRGPAAEIARLGAAVERLEAFWLRGALGVTATTSDGRAYVIEAGTPPRPLGGRRASGRALGAFPLLWGRSSTWQPASNGVGLASATCRVTRAVRVATPRRG
jgi:hypothetical protein